MDEDKYIMKKYSLLPYSNKGDSSSLTYQIRAIEDAIQNIKKAIENVKDKISLVINSPTITSQSKKIMIARIEGEYSELITDLGKAQKSQDFLRECVNYSYD